MKHLAPASLALALACGVLTGCGDDGPDTASDPGSSSSAAQTTPPADPPGDEAYPGFEPEDYTYTLALSCFCPDAGTPVTVTVVDDEVTEAVYAADSDGRGLAHEGDPAPEAWRLTIDDVIDAANEATAEGAAKVEVDWPDGQDYPDRVYIDQDENMADEEVGYSLSGVTPG